MTSDPYEVLDGCHNRHCHRLYTVLTVPHPDLSPLSREDVFYPLRHHHRSGLALEFDGLNVSCKVVWDRGDELFIVQPDEPRATWPRVHPQTLWDEIQGGRTALDVTTVTPPGSPSHE